MDLSGRSVGRAESKTGGALMASAKMHFEFMREEIVSMATKNKKAGWGICMHSYRQDATNDKRKRSTLELESSYLVATSEELKKDSVSWGQHGLHLRRLSDVLCIEDETAAGTLGFTKKALASLGCPTWDDIKRMNQQSPV